MNGEKVERKVKANPNLIILFIWNSPLFYY
jgi:hypothetical protein